MRALGVDGITGGIAVVDHFDDGTSTLVDAIDIPIVGTGAKQRIDPVAIRNFIERHRPALALIERGQAMPRQGASSGFKYGRACGAIEATVMLCAVPVEIVEPPVWKRYWKLPGKDKEAARQKAMLLFPTAHALLAPKRDHGRAEALLIAAYGVGQSMRVAA
jgi:hypothetical protein